MASLDGPSIPDSPRFDPNAFLNYTRTMASGRRTDRAAAHLMLLVIIPRATSGAMRKSIFDVDIRSQKPMCVSHVAGRVAS